LRKKIKFKLAPYQKAAVYSPYDHTGFFGGVGVGKSFSLAHFDIRMFEERPDIPGFIGANSYDQLNQATLRESLRSPINIDRNHVKMLQKRGARKRW